MWRLATLILGLALGAALAAPASAQGDPGRSIEGVIGRQMDAFRADDMAGAFAYASPGIRRLFGDSQNFGRMVREGYPMVYRPAEVDFGALSPDGDGFRQHVTVRDEAGAYHQLEYRMIRTPEGWQIDGVRILEAPQVGA